MSKKAKESEEISKAFLSTLYKLGATIRNTGDEKVFFELKKTFDCFKRLADSKDNEFLMYTVGHCYEYGVGGIRINMSKAVTWYIK